MAFKDFINRFTGKEITQKDAQKVGLQLGVEASNNPIDGKGVVDIASRPLLDLRTNEQMGTFPKFWVRYNEFYKFRQASDILNTIINARKREIFRRGIRIKDAEGKDVTGLQPHDESPPSKVEEDLEGKKKELLESFIRQANANDQSLIEVLKELEDDACTYDDVYLGSQFEYEVDDQGRITAKFAKEFFRLHPQNVQLLCDQRNRLGRDPNGNKVYFSVHDRATLISADQAQLMKYKDPKHGTQLFPAHFKFTQAGASAANTSGGGTVYYAPWEIKHSSRFAPTLTYSSCPPIMSIWMKVWTLVKMDEYVMQSYALQRPPKFFLVFNTTNATSLEKSYQQMIQRARADPHVPQILANETKGTEGGVQTVELLRSMEEMQFTEVREEYRKQIGAPYGVMPIWHADTSQTGGLNNESMQITVTNREMESSQAWYNEKFLLFVARSIGVYDFKLELEPTEEMDEVAEEQRRAMKIQNARAMLDMGMNVHFDKETGEFSFSGQPVAQGMANPFGGGLDSLPNDNIGGDGFNDSLPETGFQSKSTASGTPNKDIAQRDGKVKKTTKPKQGFQKPARSGR